MNSGERIKSIRDKAGLSQSKFAESIQTSQNKIKDIELNRQKIPTELGQKISKKYNVDFCWLLTGEGEMSSTEDPTDEELIQLRKTVANFFNTTEEKATKIAQIINESEGDMLMDLFVKAFVDNDIEAAAELTGILKFKMAKNKK